MENFLTPSWENTLNKGFTPSKAVTPNKGLILSTPSRELKPIYGILLGILNRQNMIKQNQSKSNLTKAIIRHRKLIRSKKISYDKENLFERRHTAVYCIKKLSLHEQKPHTVKHSILLTGQK